MNVSRKHHFISQFYLRGFTANGAKKSKLFVMDVKRCKLFESTPQGVAYVVDFNYVEGLPPDALEKSLSEFEGLVATALRKIAADQTLNDHDAFIHVMNLACLFATRNPALRENMRRAQEQTARIVADLATSTPERWALQLNRMKAAGTLSDVPEVPYEDVRKFVANGDYTVSVSTTRHVQMELRLFDKVLPCFVERNWQLCIAPPESAGFVTSDHPVVLINSDQSQPTFTRPIGFGLTGTTVLFPLSKTLLAVGVFDGASGVRTLTEWQVAYFNSVIFFHADTQVYGSSSNVKFVLGSNSRLASGSDMLDALKAKKTIGPR